MPLPPHLKQKYSPAAREPSPTSPAPVRNLDTAYNQMLEKMTPEVEEAFRYVQPHNLRKTMQNISQLDEIPRQQETQRMRRAMRTSKDCLKASARLRAVAQREGRQDIADRLDEARQRALRGE